MIHVENKVCVYEMDGQVCEGGDQPYVVVKSHWNLDTRVVLLVGDSEVTVVGADLRKAIENATNVGIQ